MIKTCLLIFLLPLLLLAQYRGERVVEKSFEAADYYFRSYYLNPYNLKDFGQAAPGLLDNPFLKLHLNPAGLQPDSARNALVYLDFRSDREEFAPYVGYRPTPYDRLEYIAAVIDPRWYTTVIKEPQPIFSLGLLVYPFGKSIQLAATWQMLYQVSPYYQTPTRIYNSRYGYDYLGREAIADNVPIVDRRGGQDEMVDSGQRASAFLSWEVFSDWQIGLGANWVLNQREGTFGKFYNPPYSNSEEQTIHYNRSFRKKRQNYWHSDVSMGLMYRRSAKGEAGITLGYLQGDADQHFSLCDSSLYDNRPGSEPDNWHFHYNRNRQAQSWHHQGGVWHSTLYFTLNLAPQRRLRGYYTYRNGKIDLTNHSVIFDTSRYAGRRNNQRYNSQYLSWYVVDDRRKGSGSKNRTEHEAQLSLLLNETNRTKMYVGLYFKRSMLAINILEPALVNNRSYFYRYTYNYDLDESRTFIRRSRLYEDKELEWIYTAWRQTVQIPVMLRFKVGENWHLMLSANKIWQMWRIEDQTTAYFATRYQEHNGTVEQETDFGERYREPIRSFSENYIQVICGLDVSVSEHFHVRMLMDPETVPDLHVAMLWLAFELNL